MKLSNADRDRLDDYLMNRLEAADRKVVEQLIASDPDWKEAFEQQQLLKSGLAQSHLVNRLNQLRDLEKKRTGAGDLTGEPALKSDGEAGRPENVPMEHEEIPDVQALRYHSLMQVSRRLRGMEDRRISDGVRLKGGRRRWLWGLGVAASVILVVGLGLWMRPKEPYRNQYLLAHFNEYVLHNKTRSTEPQPGPKNWKGYDLYVLQDFQAAIPYLKEEWEINRDTLALFYLGVSYAGVGELEKSEKILEKLLKLENVDSQKLSKILN